MSVLKEDNFFNQEEIIEEFELLTKNSGKVQEDILRKILEENKETEYLWQKCGLNGRTDPKSFKDCVPLVVHKDLEPYIQRIANGDSSPILTSKPISALSRSSGTTQGKPKYIPFTNDMFNSSLFVFRTSLAYRNREFPIENGKVLQFLYSSKELQRSKGGLAVGPVSTHVVNNPKYMETLKSMNTPCCSPSEVIFSPDIQQSLYCHLLCGLIFRDEIQFVSSVFAHALILAFRTFEQVWEELCSDIRSGVLSSRITIPALRCAMASKVLIKPNAELAGQIHAKCERLTENDWYGVIPELFPHAKYIHSVMTGSMQPYVKKLRQYAGELPLVCSDYGASEGWVGLNVNPRSLPEMAIFTVLPNVAYFEFIPLMNSEDMEPSAVDLTQVKDGEQYEVVITNGLGLYRYRLGDIVEVRGFHNSSTPQLRFVRRKNLLLNIDIDKNTEEDVQLSVETAAKILSDSSSNLELLDFTSHVNTSTYPGHYVVFWEVNGEESDHLHHHHHHQVLQECCNCLDSSFLDLGYMTSRKARTIGPLELKIVRRGTFNKILNHYVGLGTAATQFKSPRFVGDTNGAVLEILMNNVVITYSSTAYP